MMTIYCSDFFEKWQHNAIPPSTMGGWGQAKVLLFHVAVNISGEGEL